MSLHFSSPLRPVKGSKDRASGKSTQGMDRGKIFYLRRPGGGQQPLPDFPSGLFQTFYCEDLRAGQDNRDNFQFHSLLGMLHHMILVYLLSLYTAPRLNSTMLLNRPHFSIPALALSIKFWPAIPL